MVVSGLSVAVAFVGVALEAMPATAASMVTNTYTYTGVTETFVVPSGVTTITVGVTGGQGGIGGGDSQGLPTPGGYQGVVTGVMAVQPGDVITIAVGGGGGTGTSSQGNAPGGSAGQNPLPGYDGATGGMAGPAGSSGGGGGGGAASVLRVGTTDIVAGGAGGNGGNGQFLPIVGRRAEETHIPRPDAVSTSGRPGLDTHLACSPDFGCDGGASGAGGGGLVGGDRGQVQYGGASATEYFGFGGFPGANSTADSSQLTASYDYYAGNGADGTITLTYDDGAPGAPTNLAGAAGTNSIDLFWGAPTSLGSSPISDYRVEIATALAGPFSTVADGVSTSGSATIPGLTNGVGYFFRVAAINGEGAGAIAATSLALVPSDVPGAPTITTVSSIGGGLSVTLTPPTSDIPITSYDFRLDGGTWTAATVASNRFSIDGLVNGRAYVVQVRAHNAIGAGPSSDPSPPSTPRDVANAPTAPLATASDASIALAWTAPTLDNGAPITDYVIQTATSIDGPFTAASDPVSASTTGTLGGLTNGTTYIVRIAAVNAVGQGPWSATTVASPFTTPSAPSLAVAPGDGSLTVSITPAFDGGSAVTGYEYRFDPAAPWTSTGTTGTTFSVAGLMNATTYDLFVRAVNAAGAGLTSAPATATPRSVPAAPAISTVALDTGAVSVAFAVGSDGGSPVTNVQYSIDGGTTWITRSPAGAASPLTIGGLSGGATYIVQLRLVNAAGVSVASNPSTVTAKGAPAAPTVTLTSGDHTLSVAFAAPSNGGTPITNYQYSTDGGTNWITRSPAATSSPIVISGLTNGIAYDVRIRASNAVGNGASSITSVATPASVPAAPIIVGGTASGSDGVLDVVFTAPTDDGGSPSTTYQYSTDAGATWRNRDTTGTTSPLRITTISTDGTTPLTGGLVYPVEIRAVNAAGAGLASAVADGITTTVPSAPSGIVVESRDAAVSVRFDAPSNGGSTITAFQYRLGTGEWTATGTLADTFVIAGLVNATTSLLEIRAVNGVGAGPASPTIPITSRTTPQAPTITGISAGDQVLVAAFVPAGNGGSPVTGFEYSTDGGTTWVATSGTTSPITIGTRSTDQTPLVNAVVVPVQLRATNAAGPGAASATVLASPRGTPTAVSAVVLTPADGALIATFDTGSDGGSPITGIEYRLDDGPWIDPGSSNSPLTINGLDNGRDYAVSIRTRNIVDAGPGSAVVTGTPRTRPDMPTVTGSAAVTGTVTLTWDAPASDGGAPITGYVAMAFDQSTGGTSRGTCSTAAGTCTITGLTNGNAVYVDVVAVNSAGSGPPSAPRVALTPLGRPAVAIASVVPGATQLTVDVSVVDDGGAPITRLEYQVDEQPWRTVADSTSRFVVAGLSTGVTYSVRVRATSLAGTGTASSPVAAVPHVSPTVPTALSATSGDRSAVLSWTAPVDNGGQPVTDYIVQFGTDPSGPFTAFDDGTSVTTSALVTGLSNATSYVFRVAAANTAGAGGWSGLASATPLGAPSAPTITTVTPGSRFLQVAFSAPASTGGTAITGYQYTVDGTTWRALSTVTSPTTITGLDNGRMYDVQLRAVNAVGGGEASSAVAAKSYGLPAAIAGFRATPTSNSVTLEWDNGNDNGSAITAYNVIRWSSITEGGIADSFQTTDTSHTFAGLGSDTFYFTVEATNAAGTGPRSSPRTTAIVGGTVPDVPTAVTTTVSGAAATMSWTNGDPGTSAIDSALVQHSADGTMWSTVSAGTGVAAFDVPDPGTPYWLRVASVSMTGVGPFAVTRPPTAITGPVSGVDHHGASVTATVNANDGDATVTFEVATQVGDLGTPLSTIVAADPAMATGTNDRSVTAVLSELSPGTRYVVRAVASGPSGSVAGAPVSFSTDAVLTVAGLDRTYTASPLAPAVTTEPAELAVQYAYEGIAPTVYATTAIPPTPVGTYRVTIAPVDGTIGGGVVVTMTVAPAELSLDVVASSRAYDGATTADLDVELVGVVPGDEVALDLTKISGAFDDAAVGPDKAVTVTVGAGALTGTDAHDYDLTSPSTVTATITRATQTVAFASTAPEGDHAMVGGAYRPVAISSMRLAVTLSIEGDGSVCAIIGGRVVLTAPGTCTIGAAQPGNANIAAAAPVNQSFVVMDVPVVVPPVPSRTTQIVTIPSLADVFVGSGPTTLPSATAEGLALSYTAGPPSVCTAQGTTITVVGRGTCTVTAAQAGDATHLPASAVTSFVVASRGGYTPMVADRVLDTRISGDPLRSATEHVLAIPSGVVPTEASAIVLNVAVTESRRGGFVTVHPCGTMRPLAAAINFSAGETKANLVDAPYTSGTPLCLWSNVDTHVVVDLQGFHSSSGAGRPVPRTNQRLTDTRPDDAMTRGQVMRVPVIGEGLAAPGTIAVALNVAVDAPTDAGFLTVYPCGVTRPWASNLNFVGGQTVSNEVMVEPGVDGSVCIYTSAPTQLIVDLNATFETAGTAAFSAGVATRLADTRGETRLSAGQVRSFSVVPDDSAPAVAVAASLNIAVSGPAAAGFLTVYPCGVDRPWASNLNFAAGQTISNHVTATVGSNGTVCVYTSQATDVVIDLEGLYRTD